jgi:hypothetical protein
MNKLYRISFRFRSRASNHYRDRRQQTDDRDHDQKFDESKSTTFHGYILAEWGGSKGLGLDVRVKFSALKAKPP